MPSPLCKYFSQNGTCRNGSNCAFRHVMGVEKSSSKNGRRSPPRTKSSKSNLIEELTHTVLASNEKLKQSGKENITVKEVKNPNPKEEKSIPKADVCMPPSQVVTPSLLWGTYVRHSPESDFQYELKLKEDGNFELNEFEGRIKRSMLGCCVIENNFLKMTKNAECIMLMDGTSYHFTIPDQTLQAPFKYLVDYNSIVLKLEAFKRTLCFYKSTL